MKKYAVTVIEKLSRSIEIEADSETDAILKAQAMWRNGEIILGDRDFEGTEYKVDSIIPEYPCINCWITKYGRQGERYHAFADYQYMGIIRP